MLRQAPTPFAARLRSLMRPGETQAAFAKRLGVAQPTVNDWLHQDSPPRRSSLEVAGKNLNVDPAWLRSGRGEPRPYPVRAGGEPAAQQAARNLAFAQHVDAIADAVEPTDELARELETLIAECDERRARYVAMLRRLHQRTDAAIRQATKGKGYKG